MQLKISPLIMTLIGKIGRTETSNSKCFIVKNKTINNYNLEASHLIMRLSLSLRLITIYKTNYLI